MSKDLTNSEWLKQIRDDFGKIFSEKERERFNIIIARLEQLERENAELLDLAYYECSQCGQERAYCDGEPSVLPPGHDSSDGLEFVRCPECDKNLYANEVKAGLHEPALGPNPTVPGIVRDSSAGPIDPWDVDQYIGPGKE